MKIALPFPPKKQRSTVEKPTAARQRKRSNRIRNVLIAVVLIILVGGIAFWRLRTTEAPAPSTTSVPIIRANLDILVESTGKVQPARSINLPFQSSGQISEVLVKPGDRVTAGQPLARLDSRNLNLGLQQAEADLKTAQAGLDKVKNGSATPQDLAQARARLNASAAALQKARTGNVTAADVRTAEADVSAAQARLDALKNPSQDKINAAQFALTQAQINLQKTRDALSAAKTNAKLTMDKAVQALVQAQSSYSTALQNWEYVQSTGNDPQNPTTVGPNGKSVDNKLNDTQRQQYYDAYIKAQAAMHSAEQEVQQAQVNYDTARQNEVTGVQEADAQQADAQKKIDVLQNPQPSSLREAQAELARAQAQLDKLRQGGTHADVLAAQAQVDESRAGLEKLTAPAGTSDIEIAESNVAQAQAKLEEAKINLDNATLKAPFDATVAVVGIDPGSIVNESVPAFTLVDISSLHIDLNVNETDVVQIKTGQSVHVTFDMLPNREFTGTVRSVATTGKEDQSLVTYLVQVQFDPASAPIKIGMSANASIQVERHENVLQVPNGAINTEGAAKSIKLLYGKEQTPVTVHIEAGATNGTMTEIVSCIDSNNMCLREGDKVLIDTPNAAGPEGNGMIRIGGPPGDAPQNIKIGGP